MISFIISLIALVVEKVFGVDENIQTPAIRLEDGVDYVTMPE